MMNSKQIHFRLAFVFASVLVVGILVPYAMPVESAFTESVLPVDVFSTNIFVTAGNRSVRWSTNVFDRRPGVGAVCNIKICCNGNCVFAEVTDCCSVTNVKDQVISSLLRRSSMPPEMIEDSIQMRTGVVGDLCATLGAVDKGTDFFVFGRDRFAISVWGASCALPCAHLIDSIIHKIMLQCGRGRAVDLRKEIEDGLSEIIESCGEHRGK